MMIQLSVSYFGYGSHDWKQTKRKKEIPEGECIVAEKEKCESERRRDKCDGGGWDIS